MIKFKSDNEDTGAGFSLTLQCRGNFKQINNKSDIFKIQTTSVWMRHPVGWTLSCGLKCNSIMKLFFDT